jgi:hypothetical protein
MFNIELTERHGDSIFVDFLECFDQARSPMFPNQQENWLALYKAALLELDLQKMPERIALANKALQERLRELQESCGHYGERLEIQYAERNLHVAERMK